jgi:bifunctional non-homologous end joining protein LigD
MTFSVARGVTVYAAFDVLWLDGADWRFLPLSERRPWLRSILPTKSPFISEVLSVRGRGHELFELVRRHDLEGIVAKRLDDPYDSSVHWFKIKNPGYSQKEGRGELLNRPRRRPGS